MNVVVDTNIFISALIKEGFTRKMLVNSKHNFLFPEFEFEEIYNHKQEIIEKSHLSEIELDILLLRLLKHVRIIPTEMIIKYYKDAKEIMKEIDEDDSIFIATALTFNCPIWSDDKHFQKQNSIKIYTTKDLFKLGI